MDNASSDIRSPDGAHVRRYETVLHMLDAAVADFPDRAALTYEDITLTYAEMQRAVNGLATRLLRAGARGRSVVIALPNRLELALALFGIYRAGAIATPLNPAYTARELRTALQTSRPALAIVDDATAPKIEADIPLWVIPDEAASWLRSLSSQASPEPAPVLPGDLAALQFTGGTTGRAKAVEITHGAMAINIAQREALLPTERGDERIVCIMPLFHVFAISMCLHLSVNAGGHLIIQSGYRPKQLIDAIDRYSVTRLPAGPTVFISLLNYEALEPERLKSLRSAYSGSAPLSTATLASWESRVGVPIYEGYGQSESGPVLTFNSPHFPTRAGSVGRALPNTDIDIVDSQTGLNSVAQGSVGEIRARGPQVMRGYRDLPDETSAALREGWLYTGDLGHLDADGYLYIDDRKKDMVLVSGYNVYPREIDEILAAAPGVVEAAVVGIEDSYRGGRLIAFVVPTNAEVRAEDLERHCAENLVHYKHPSEFRLVDALPKTTVGKVDKPALRRAARGVA